MKTTLIILLLISASLIEAQSEQACVDKYVDSVFIVNFNKMQKAIVYCQIDDNSVDRSFIQFISIASGISPTKIDFGSFYHYDQEKLDEWEKWYNLNKCKIKKDHVTWGLGVINNIERSDLELDSLFHLKYYFNRP